MKFIADLHIHSRFSVATSADLVPERIEYWARCKGIDVVGTGDCVHPGWAEECAEKLEPVGNGLYRLKDCFRLDESRRLSGTSNGRKIFFVLTGEVSNIYKRNGKVRKVHNLCLFPDFESAARVRARLDRMANIRSDGRPILGLDSSILLEMVLESSDRSYLIPCHVWTPWFSVLGANSGFDCIEECFGDLTGEVFAIETGLSSDPAMNRLCGFLDRFTLVSNSDAHSPEKLGREANLFDTDLTFDAMRNALKTARGFLGTIEFFPQEGKYHFDGHRKCGVRWDPQETLRHGGICIQCGKPVTKGVMHRVVELADRDQPIDTGKVFRRITPLADLLAEIMDVKSSASKKVAAEYLSLVGRVGPEFYILLDATDDELRKAGGDLLAEAVGRLRRGDVLIEEGYDGAFGRVRVFRPGERARFAGVSLFVERSHSQTERKEKAAGSGFKLTHFKETHVAKPVGHESRIHTKKYGERSIPSLTALQREAVEHTGGPCMVIAGPGTGKTAILSRRIAWLVRSGYAQPEEILALTFSNRAAKEMIRRVEAELPASGVAIDTFHGFGLSILRAEHAAIGRTENFFIADEDDAAELIRTLVRDRRSVSRFVSSIESIKNGLGGSDDALSIMDQYDRCLVEMNAVDIADLVYLPLKLFREDPAVLARCRARYRWILVDEAQDMNPAQYGLLRALAGDGSPELFVIGDPDQAIYGFRGSDPQCMQRLTEEYSEMRIIRLDTSFRCPDPIMKAAAQILGRSDTPAGRESDLKLHLQEFPSERSEADWIASCIEKAVGGVRSFSIYSGISDGTAQQEGALFGDFAVLCRASFLFPPLEEALQNHGIPYQRAGTESFVREEPYRTALRAFTHILRGWRYPSHSEIAAAEIAAMIEKGYSSAEILSWILTALSAPIHAVKRLEEWAAPFDADYQGLLRAFALLRGADDLGITAEAVSLITIHAAKGLEFKNVFIPACEDGIIPFDLSGTGKANDMAEEERIFYVGVTRTVERLYLTYAKKRMVRGAMRRMPRSPFLDRLQESLLTKGERRSGKKKMDYQPSLFD